MLDRVIGRFADGMWIGGSGVAVAAATEAASYSIGVAAIITAAGGIIVKIMSWYTTHKGLQHRVEALREAEAADRREINRLRAHIVDYCNKHQLPLPIDLFDLEADGSDERP